MNLKRQLQSLAMLVTSTVLLSATLYGQDSVIPVHAVPYIDSGVQQFFDGEAQVGGVSSATASELWRPLGFTQYMTERYPLESQVDYTPELISTYAPLDGRSARQVGLATITDYALGHGKHSPLNPGGVAQASYLEPAVEAQSVAQLLPYQSSFSAPLFGDASNAVGAPQLVGSASLDEAPRLFPEQNIGGGRTIFKAFWDRHWTRMVLIYGGFGNSQDNGADIFDGQASTNLGLIGVDIGRRHSRFMRSSIDFTYRGGDVDFGGQEVGQVRVYSLMKNFHLDLARRGRFRPYIGVGIGGGVLDAQAALGDNFVDVQDEGGFAYQIIGGAAYNVSDLAAIYAEYRYFSINNLDVTSGSGIVEGDFSSHDVLFGLRFGY